MNMGPIARYAAIPTVFHDCSRGAPVTISTGQQQHGTEPEHRAHDALTGLPAADRPRRCVRVQRVGEPGEQAEAHARDRVERAGPGIHLLADAEQHDAEHGQTRSTPPSAPRAGGAPTAIRAARRTPGPTRGRRRCRPRRRRDPCRRRTRAGTRRRRSRRARPSGGPSRSRRTATAPRAVARKSSTPPIPIVEAPIASGLTSSGRKLAVVPVVPHSSDASTSATTPDHCTWALRDSNPRHPRCKRGALTN